MSGRAVRVLSMSEFDFGGIAKASSIVNTIAKNIDVSQWTSAELVARLHSVSWPQNGNGDASLKVIALQDGFTEEDPAASFLGSSLGSCSFTDPDPAESMVVSALSTPMSGMITVQLEASQDSGVQGTLTATLSVDLILRD